MITTEKGDLVKICIIAETSIVFLKLYNMILY